MEKLGSKYGYWKVPSQKAIFKEDWGQNVILRIFGIKQNFGNFWDLNINMGRNTNMRKRSKMQT